MSRKIKEITAISNHKPYGEKCHCYGQKSTWTRKMIGKGIKDIPRMMKRDGWWTNIIIKYK